MYSDLYEQLYQAPLRASEIALSPVLKNYFTGESCAVVCHAEVTTSRILIGCSHQVTVLHFSSHEELREDNSPFWRDTCL
jgi:hypothetical protein